MLGEVNGCFRGVCRRMVVVGGLVLVAGLLVVSPVLAAPQGIFSVFSDCPTEVPGVLLCQYGTITSGEIAIGSARVPITKPMTLQDGALPTGVEPNQYFMLPAKDGNSLSKAEQTVPGGLVDC